MAPRGVEPPVDTLTHGHDGGHLHRAVLATDGGLSVLVDLASATMLAQRNWLPTRRDHAIAHMLAHHGAAIADMAANTPDFAVVLIESYPYAEGRGQAALTSADFWLAAQFQGSRQSRREMGVSAMRVLRQVRDAVRRHPDLRVVALA